MEEKGQTIIVDKWVNVEKLSPFMLICKRENSVNWDLRGYHLDDFILIPKSWSLWKIIKYIWRER